MGGLDWAFAFLFGLASLSDMYVNYCDTGCLQKRPVDAYLSVSGGAVYFQEDHVAEEVYIRYEPGTAFGPFQLAFGASLTSDGSAWIGAGSVYSKTFADDRFYFRLEALAGLYDEGDGPDLGSELEFRTGAEIGTQLNNGMRIGLSADHRSNAEIDDVNPGLETVQLRVSYPF